MNGMAKIIQEMFLFFYFWHFESSKGTKKEIRKNMEDYIGRNLH
jgi:hypothetical protein